MYKTPNIRQSRIKINNSVEGLSIEQKIERMMQQKEPINGGSPIIYTERKDGVLPEYNIRTDRFEIAIDAMGAVDKSYKARRENNIKERENAKMDVIKNSEADRTQGNGE